MRARGLASLALGAALAAIALPQTARACGGFLFDQHDERPGGMSAQEIFLGFGTDSTTLVVSAGYSEPGGDVAFLLPIAVAPDEVFDGDMALFVALEAGTEPVVHITTEEESSSSGGGCGDGSALRGGEDAGGGFGQGEGEDVFVIDRGSTDNYDWVVVGGDTGTALEDWLTAEGFAIPDSFAGASQPYVDDGWLFLAAKLSPEATQGSMAPLELHFPPGPATAGAIPFGIGADSLATGKELSVTMYVASSEMVVPGNYGHATIERAAVQATGETTSNYPELFETALDSDSDGTWVIEYSHEGWSPAALGDYVAGAQEYGGLPEDIEYDLAYLDELEGRLSLSNARFTRFRTSLGPSQLRDLSLESSEPIDVDRDFYVQRSAPVESSPDSGVLVLMGSLPLLGLWGRRRRTRAHASGRA